MLYVLPSSFRHHRSKRSYSLSRAFAGPRWRASSSLWTGLLCLASMVVGCTQQEALFCPYDGCADRLTEEIHASSLYVHVAIAYFTHDGIADALIAAHQRGVEVMVLGEGGENHPATETSGQGINYQIVQKLKREGVPYRDDSNPNLMHHKIAVIDGETVLTGSFNYTVSADTANNENLVVMSSPQMVTAFENEFQRLWANGVE